MISIVRKGHTARRLVFEDSLMRSHRSTNETQEKTIQKMNMLKKSYAEIQNIQEMVILVVNVLS